MLIYFPLDPEEEKAEKEALEEKFKPLITWLKEEAKDIVRDGKAIPTFSSFIG